ncbi:site-specific integrase [Mycobacterium sp. SMC-8]|uniref:site-specific integrase n=1 Tax=Mycobacterium sp. SMC-8 TaxID=2857060 RepID=UPI0021B29258|nr:site-specific integrase [Mycobacterium sp. SMC-8]UXA14074.1 site-specific integrase [Mycobacterium sp. SMC-8]
MSKRQQLPPQIRKIKVQDRKQGKTVVRYQLTVDAGHDIQTGKRRQVRRRYATEKEARDALSEIGDQAAKDVFVPRSVLTVKQFCEDYTNGRHDLKETALAKLRYDLTAFSQKYSDTPLQRITKADIDALVRELVAGGSKTPNGRKRKPWGPVAVNKVIQTVKVALAAAHAEGLISRNPAEVVKPMRVGRQDVDTYTDAEVAQLLAHVADDRLAHFYELAALGLRRGELCGLRWSDVDLTARTMRIVNTRTVAAGKTVEGDTKTAASERTLPLPERAVAALRSAHTRQATERLALGLGGRGEHFGYIISNEVGQPYSPAVLSKMWATAVKAAGLRHIKLHGGGRHTAVTKMLLDGVPVPVVAAWAGHADASVTLRIYAHSQPDALKSAASSFERVVTSS